MKFRLIRFEGDKVALDIQCMTPNQQGDNYAFRDAGGKAVLIQYQTKVIKNVQSVATEDRYASYYTFCAKSSEVPEVLWHQRSLEDVCAEFKFIQMLQLTGAL